MTRGLVLVSLLLVISAVAGCGGAVVPTPLVSGHALDVIYVPTDLALVTRMLDMADVRRDDVLYDLGCGDGRIIVTAAQRLGVRGVGVDLDPVRIAEARENAVRAGVADRVRFVRQDLFDTDVSEATVVALYLAPAVNLRLRPKLLRELRPGARVVSHDYDMGDWLPEKTATVPLVNRVHRLFLWTIPSASG